ncbi:MAG: prepilin-type N-terminal cleavage/methylation domain-containing protein [Desulfobacteraceae bacterium]|nr:prepilin-type N-terminal cleavage/methylation domain-containing protein [Desulfobacteraceae bacterium]
MHSLFPLKLSQQGFTILEIMIAMAIFAIGILGVAQMQIQAVNANAYSRLSTEAVTFAQGQVEQLLSLPYDHAFLVDTDGNGTDQDLNNDGTDDNGGDFGLGSIGAAADHTLTSTPVLTSDCTYNFSWNIAIDEPENDCKRIRMIVQWQDASRKKQITLDAIKAR